MHNIKDIQNTSDNEDLTFSLDELEDLVPSTHTPTPPGHWEGAWVEYVYPFADTEQLYLKLTTRVGERECFFKAKHGTGILTDDYPCLVQIDHRGKLRAVHGWTHDIQEHYRGLGTL